MAKKIRQVAVIGAGVMGGGIAALMAGAGLRTLLLDIVPPDLQGNGKNDPQARNRIAQTGLDTVATAQPPLLMHPGDLDRIRIGNLEDDFDQLAASDWIIEVVVENIQIKQALFKRIDKVRRRDAIVSTNTSGLPLKELSKGRSPGFKAHFLGTHFFNPVRYMKLLELIPGKQTAADVLAFVADFGERRLGKGVVWAKDSPNFVGNRIGVHGMVRAMQLMLEAGLSVSQVDALFGPTMGRPRTAMFKTADLVGIDVLAHVAQNTYDLVVGDEDREHYRLPEFVNRMVAQKLLGKKTGAGFYKTELTPEWKKIRKEIDLDTLAYGEVSPAEFPCLKAAQKAPDLAEKIRAIVFGDDAGARFVWRAMIDNLAYAAKRIPEIADTIVEIDNAMRWGYNFDLGPFEVWDVLGVARTVARMQKEGLPVPEVVREMLAKGNDSFYKVQGATPYYYDFASAAYKPMELSEGVISLPALKAANNTIVETPSASLIDLGEGVVCCEFHTKMNALNSETADVIARALAYVDDNAAGLVIGNQAGGMPGAFSVGADLNLIRQSVSNGRLNEIEDLIIKVQNVLQLASYAPFPVVAAPFGLALGGGCEISLAADRIVAHAELYMGLVEVGVGLLPSLGGCTNLWKKYIRNIPQSITDMDWGKYFVPVFMTIGLAKVSTSAADARANGFLGPRDRIVFNRDHLIAEAKKEVLKMVSDGYVPPVKRPVPVVGEAGQGMIGAELYNMQKAGFISDYDVHLAQRIAFVLSGGDVRSNASVDEETLLTLERQNFMALLQEEKTLARIDHMLETGKPLRN